LEKILELSKPQCLHSDNKTFKYLPPKDFVGKNHGNSLKSLATIFSVHICWLLKVCHFNIHSNKAEIFSNIPNLGLLRSGKWKWSGNKLLKGPYFMPHV
jgi:hypothetical protein